MDIFYLDRGKLKKGKVKDLPRLKKKKIWIDVSDISQHQAALLAKTFNLHPVTKEDLLVSQGRIKVEEFPNYLFCTFYTVEKTRKGVQLTVLDYVLGKNFLISNHQGQLEDYERLKKEQDKLTRLLKAGPESVFHKLLDEQIEEFFPVLEQLDDEIDELDKEIIMRSNPKLLTNILELKRKIVEIKKISIPQREKLSILTRRHHNFIPESSKPYFRDMYDESVRISDLIDNFRESITSTFDAYMMNIANHSNDIMKVLSIIATIALPLTVIAGIYGTNFVNLPGIRSVGGFWTMMASMGVIIGGMLLFFRKKGWF